MSNQKRLAEIADIRQGRYLAPTQMFDSASEEAPIPVWGANGVLGYTENPTYTYRVPLVTCRGNGCGLVQWPDEKSYISNNAMGVEPKTKTKSDSSYLYYSLLACDFSDVITGSAQPQITVSHLSSKTVTWVDDENARNVVADILSGFDRKIDINRRINQTIEAMAQAIFKSWFVDFDPVKAKIAAQQEGRDPQHAAMSAISGKPEAELDTLPSEQYAQLAATAALFPDEMEDSELGEIPKGWEMQRVANLLELAYGKALKSTNRQEGAIPVYGSGGITGYHNTALVPNASIVVGRKGTVGSLYWEDEPFFPIDTTYYVLPLTVPLTYCYYAMQTLGLEKMNTDAAVPGLNRKNVYRLELVRPNSSVLQKFDAEVLTLRKAIRANFDANKMLANLRDTLLPKLLSGDLALTDVMTEVEK